MGYNSNYYKIYFFIFYEVITAQNENSLNSLSSSLSLSLSKERERERERERSEIYLKSPRGVEFIKPHHHPSLLCARITSLP
jgi:hypothetical protein